MGDNSKINSLAKWIFYAWRGVHRSRNEVWTPILGGLLIWAVSIAVGWQMTLPRWIADNVVLSSIALLPLCVIVAQLVIFLMRLVYWPIHCRVEPYGGVRQALRAKMGAQMWPILFMGFGVLTFVILFGLGMVLFAIQISREHQNVSDQDLINAYLLMGKSGEIKKKCSASLVGKNTEIKVIYDGSPSSIDFINTLKNLLSPEISVKSIELLPNEAIEPGISLLVPSLSPAKASYISVEWVKCLYDLGINIKIREIQPSHGLEFCIRNQHKPLDIFQSDALQF